MSKFDLSDHVGIDVFDQTIRAIEKAVEDPQVQELRLDRAEERAVLVRVLWRALGVAS